MEKSSLRRAVAEVARTALLSGAILIGSERALFKGIAAGVLGCVLTMFLFAAIGGGFHVTPLFCLELPLTGILCGFGALVGGKFRKA